MERIPAIKTIYSVAIKVTNLFQGKDENAKKEKVIKVDLSLEEASHHWHQKAELGTGIFLQSECVRLLYWQNSYTKLHIPLLFRRE